MVHLPTSTTIFYPLHHSSEQLASKSGWGLKLFGLIQNWACKKNWNVVPNLAEQSVSNCRVSNAVSALCVRQTVIGDCSFCSSIAIAAHYERRSALCIVDSPHAFKGDFSWRNQDLASVWLRETYFLKIVRESLFTILTANTWYFVCFDSTTNLSTNIEHNLCSTGHIILEWSCSQSISGRQTADRQVAWNHPLFWCWVGKSISGLVYAISVCTGTETCSALSLLRLENFGSASWKKRFLKRWVGTTSLVLTVVWESSLC